MKHNILVKNYSPPPVNEAEILRYMGCQGVDTSTESLSSIHDMITDCLDEALPRLVYKVCWSVFDISLINDTICFPFGKVRSRSFSKFLNGCDSAVIFAATIGIEIDRLISKHGRLSPSKALCFQAIGAERIESLCNIFCADMSSAYARDGIKSKARFSPGYGDLSLSFQEKIFNVLDCNRKIGLFLSDSLLMTPSKSVTAIICLAHDTVSGAEGVTGIDKTQDTCADICAKCNKTQCAFRAEKS